MTAINDSGRGRCTCVVGLQWGDEAKGKIVDLLADEHDFVVRYNGGANAGHTVVRDGKTYKFSLLPTGVLRPNVISVIANGVVVHPVKFLEEVEQLRKAGLPVNDRLILSDRAHLIFPYHLEEERLNEQGKNDAIGTTGRGIGPCYQDKVGRICGVRVGELCHPDTLRNHLGQIIPRKNRMLKALSEQAATFDVVNIFGEYLAYAEKMKPFIGDATKKLQDGFKSGQSILFEAAQGSLLDIDHGTYPFVTSSNSSVAGVWTGSGISARKLDRVIGVTKAYTTRVGRGPFPTELDDGPDGIGERIRKVGKEYGTVTGRPRRCGWLDTVAIKYTSQLCDIDEMAVMLLDVLSGIEELKICTAYEIEGDRIEDFPVDLFVLEKCRPVYETLPGWSEPIDGIKTLKELPTNAQRYIDRISELLEKRVGIASVGPDHDQTIFCD